MRKGELSVGIALFLYPENENEYWSIFFDKLLTIRKKSDIILSTND